MQTNRQLLTVHWFLKRDIFLIFKQAVPSKTTDGKTQNTEHVFWLWVQFNPHPANVKNMVSSYQC